MGGLGTLGFLAPLWGALAVPVVAGLVALYTIRSQPKQRVLPSIRLWQEVLRRKRPNTLLSRYRNSLFFLLQLLALGLMLLALTQPFRRSETSGEILIAVDVSASMGARDGRWQVAQDRATELVEAMDATGRAALVAVGPTPQARLAATGDKGALRAAIRSLAVQEGPDMAPEDLLALLGSLRTPATHLVHVITDHYKPEDFPGGLPGSRIRFHYVGSSDENVGITRLDVRPQGTGYQVAALIRNYARLPAEVVVELDPPGQQPARQETIPPAGRERLVVFQDAQPQGGVLGVRMRVARGPSDRLSADDAAWSAPRRGAVRILLVSASPARIQRALELNPSVSVQVAAPGALPAAEDLAAFDLVVADRVLDPRFDALPVLLFHPAAASPYSSGARVATPELTGLDTTHPVNRYLSLREVGFHEAVALDKLEGGTPLLHGADGPLAVALDGPGNRRVLCAFHLDGTDLAERVGFPILLVNAVRWLLANDSKLRGQFRVGQSIRLGGTGPVQVTGPGGTPAPASPQGGVLAPFEATGVYRIQVGKGIPLPYPVNLLDPAESEIRPRGSDTDELGEAGAVDPQGEGQLEIWRLLVLAALAVLSLEWLLLAVRGGAS